MPKFQHFFFNESQNCKVGLEKRPHLGSAKVGPFFSTWGQAPGNLGPPNPILLGFTVSPQVGDGLGSEPPYGFEYDIRYITQYSTGKDNGLKCKLGPQCGESTLLDIS